MEKPCFLVCRKFYKRLCNGIGWCRLKGNLNHTTNRSADLNHNIQVIFGSFEIRVTAEIPFGISTELISLWNPFTAVGVSKGSRLIGIRH